MSWHDPTFDHRINVGYCDLYFMVKWFCVISWRLFDVWTLYFGCISRSSDFASYLEDWCMNIKFVIMSQCDVAFGLNNCRSLLPTFSWPSDFAMSWIVFNGWTSYFVIISQCDTTFDPQRYRPQWSSLALSITRHLTTVGLRLAPVMWDASQIQLTCG